jgi:putrescine transport system substrate-binding protein
VVPKEGTMVWFEAMAIPADAPNVENAYRLIDHLLEPRVAAGYTNAIFYPSGVAGASELVDGALREEPAVYPSASVMKRLFADAPVTPAYERKRQRLWTTMKAGGSGQAIP